MDGLPIALRLRIELLKPARVIPTLRKLPGELSCPCSCLLFRLASPVCSFVSSCDPTRSCEWPQFAREGLLVASRGSRPGASKLPRDREGQAGPSPCLPLTTRFCAGRRASG